MGSWSARASQPRRVRVWTTHLDKLIALYTGHGNDNRLLSRVFNVLQRYETLSCMKSGNQSALPVCCCPLHRLPEVDCWNALQQRMFAALRDEFGVQHECFASPLNATLARYGYLLIVPA